MLPWKMEGGEGRRRGKRERKRKVGAGEWKGGRGRVGERGRKIEREEGMRKSLSLLY